MSPSFHALHVEAAGAITIQAVRRVEALRLIGEAATGNPYSTRIVDALTQALRDAEEAPTGRGPVCVACRREQPPPNRFNLAVVTALSDRPVNALTMIVCEACGTSLHAITGHALHACRQVWRDVRPIAVHETVGHA